MLAKWLPLVKVYDSDSPKTALLNGDVDLGIVWSGEAAILIQEQGKKFAYVLPKEGAHMFIDNLAIPKGAENVEIAHKFINYVLRPDVSKKISEDFPYTNPNIEARKLLTAGGAREPGELPARQPEARDLPRHRRARRRRGQAVHRPEGEERVLGGHECARKRQASARRPRGRGGHPAGPGGCCWPRSCCGRWPSWWRPR